MPTNEPWAGHPRADVAADQDEANACRAAQNSGHTSNGNVVTETTKKEVQTGEGVQTINAPMDGSRCPIGVGTRSVSNETFNAIKEASDKSGVPMAYMLAMAERESGFNPQARVPASLAKGLYQFIDGTWSTMVKRYGGTDGVGTGDAMTP